MAINFQRFEEVVRQLSEDKQQTVYEFACFLAAVKNEEANRPDWDEIRLMEPDDLPLSEEEKRQLSSNEGYVTGEEAKREFNLKVDLP